MPLLEVGRVVKPHGLRGDVVVELVTNREERVAAGAVLRSGDRLLGADRGQRDDAAPLLTLLAEPVPRLTVTVLRLVNAE